MPGSREYLSFRHLAFQEYASANILLDIWRKDTGRAWSFLQPRLHHRSWQQPILLMAGKMEPNEIDSLLERIRNNHGLWQEALLSLLGGLGERLPSPIWRLLARGSPYERIIHLDLRLCLDVLNEWLCKPKMAESIYRSDTGSGSRNCSEWDNLD